MVGYFLPEDQVGLIGLAIQLSAGILMLKTWFSILWDPHLIEWISTKNPSFYISKLKIAITLICIVFFSITILTKVWSEPVVGIIYPDFFLSISDLLPIIALTVAFSVLSFVGIATLFIENTTKTRNTVYGLALLINFVTAYYLIPIQGVKGAVLSSLLGEVSIFISWIIIGKYVFKNLHLNWNIAILAGAGTFIFIYYFSFGSFLDPFLERMIITGGIIIINFYVGSAFLFNKKRQTE
jgi:O-antigen/teichoic acid export membrane protein